MSYSYDDYSICLVAQSSHQFVTAKIALDDEHPKLPRPPGDTSSYTLGRIGSYNVVIAVELPWLAGEHTLVNIYRTFPNVRYGLSLGEACIKRSSSHDIWLGDLIVGEASGARGTIRECGTRGDHHVKAVTQSTLCDTLDFDGVVLSSAIETVEAYCSSDSTYLRAIYLKMLKQYPALELECRRPTTESSRLIASSERDTKVHRGLLGTTDQSILDAALHEQVESYSHNEIEFLVIRGITEHDEYPGDVSWEFYASALVAAYARAVVLALPLATQHNSNTSTFRNQTIISQKSMSQGIESSNDKQGILNDRESWVDVVNCRGDGE